MNSEMDDNMSSALLDGHYQTGQIIVQAKQEDIDLICGQDKLKKIYQTGESNNEDKHVHKNTQPRKPVEGKNFEFGTMITTQNSSFVHKPKPR